MPTSQERRAMIARIRGLPQQLESLVAELSPADLTGHHLAGEWSVAQNVHHLADTHMNAYIRFKLILVEDYPTLKPYNQDDWARTADAVGGDIMTSLAILSGLHERWADLMESLDEQDWTRRGSHPEQGDISLDRLLEYYSGHGELHIAQINKTLAARP